MLVMLFLCRGIVNRMRTQSVVAASAAHLVAYYFADGMLCLLFWA